MGSAFRFKDLRSLLYTLEVSVVSRPNASFDLVLLREQTLLFGRDGANQSILCFLISR